jgi:hypothetical protein
VNNRYSDEVVRQGEAFEDSQDMGALAMLSRAADTLRLMYDRRASGWLPGVGRVYSMGLTAAEMDGAAKVLGSMQALLSRSVVRQGHTPGPWTVEERGSGITSALAEALEPAWTHLVTMPAPPFAFGKTGAAVSAGYSSGGKVSLKDRAEAAANARLIAKAPAIPSLLSALRPIAAAYPDEPGTSDLDDEQPVTITLGHVRRARAAIREVEGGGR